MAQLENHTDCREPQTCPGCKGRVESTVYRYRHDAGDSFIYRCEQCTLQFLRPLALREVAERKMESVNDAEMFHSNLLRLLHERLIIGPEIARVRLLLGRKDFTMLDVGCGTGWISRIWADSGARVTGMEPSLARAEIARDRGLRVLSCYAEDLATDEQFDLIVIRHVVEHLEAPEVILRNLAHRLAPNGVLLLVVPNIDCIGRKVFDSDWSWILPWHCNFFTPGSLSSMLRACGYDIGRIYQTPSPLWYPQSFARRFPRIGALLNTTPLSMLLFAPLVGLGYLTGFSDNITVLARSPQSRN